MRKTDIPGQSNLKDVVGNMIDNNRLPHALLLHAQEGGSSLAIALWIAQNLMCSDRSNGDACGLCANCTKHLAATHPDVHFVIPVNTNKQVKKRSDAVSDSYLESWRKRMEEGPWLSLLDWYRAIDIEKKQGNIGIDESKSLREKLALRSFEGGYRVFIIWHADRMNTEFGNKMLKSFEEPNEKTVFILTSEQPQQLLSTILSRTQIIEEEPTTSDQIAQFLETRFGLDPTISKNLAFRSEGNIVHAIKEAQHEDEPWLDEFKDWMRHAWKRDIPMLYTWSEKMAQKSRDAERQFISGALMVLDRCFRMGWVESGIPMESDEAKFYNDFSPYINAANVEGFMKVLEETSTHIERNVNAKMVWFDSGIQVVRLLHQGKKALESA
ncbi:MAG: hypothetical protein HOE95_00115 [Flavobacteriales bacterium]|nr:hypothetical protein [Flavobacteriales bacterium]MBT4930647.1 hypothetical protein [Flavobacteriales bacterium]MBT5133327.1 hypothetical protein [Flavobacteriales bacterium]MBT6133478.1 hypothetical protein [Flavobacteriales bacterium]MBT7688405.1 hypothetical protein [Flavobacteriales bacterium]